MSNHIGLYFPFIHFRDEAWLKLSLLYWDRIVRIVPPGFETHDSDAVKELAGEAGLIDEYFPLSESMSVGEAFTRFVSKHEMELRRKYDVDRAAGWPLANSGSRTVPAADPHLAYIFSAKIPECLIDAMVDTKLAVRGGPREPHWIGMHPKLAGVYMTALAEQAARENRFTPVTHEAGPYLALGDCTLPRLAKALLPKHAVSVGAPEEDEMAGAMALISLRCAIPEKLADVPPSKIIEFRKRYRAELSGFQGWMHSLGSRLTTEFAELQNPKAMKIHMRAVTEKEVIPRIAELRKQLSSIGIDTVLGTSAVKIGVPPLLSSLEDMMPAIVADHPSIGGIIGTASIVLSLVPFIRKRRAQTLSRIKSSPEAFLMYAQEDLSPRSAMKRLTTAVRRAVANG